MTQIYKFSLKLISTMLAVLFLGMSSAQAQSILTIGSGSTTTSYFPIYSCYSYNYSQQIYTEAELTMAGAAGPGEITKVMFKTGPSVLSVDNFKDWVIYMGNTSVNSFASGSSWIPLGELTEVWNGVVDPLTGSTWVEFTLTTPFLWDGVSNIVVAVDENTPGWTCSQYWASYSAGSNRGILYYSDGTNPDPASPPNANYGPNSTLAQVQFEYTPSLGCEEVEFTTGTLTGGDVCPATPFTVVNTGGMLASGISREWQERIPSGTGVWTTIAGAGGANYYNATGITEPADYRCIVTCDATGATDTTNEVTFNLNPFLDCYCIPTYSWGCDFGSRVDGFETSGAAINISNLGTGCASSIGYSDYSADHQVTAMQFSDVTQSTTIGSYSGGIKIWVDWNQDGVFHPTDELVAASTSTISSGSTFTSTFTVPLTATPGETRMRVRVNEGSTSFDPCGSGGYGETEDYAFIVTPAVSCADASITFPATATAVANPDMVCGTGDVSFYVEEMMPIATGITYVWQSAPTAAGPWTDVSTESMFDEYAHTGVSENTYFRCNILCEGSNVLYTTPAFVESVVPEPPTLFDGEACGPDSVLLTGDVGSGEIFWFEDAVGGTPFAVGDSVHTPFIESTSTFYAAAGAYPPALVQIGESTTTTSSSPGPFQQFYRRSTVQMMYTAEQLIAAGASPGTFDELRFYLVNTFTYPLPDYTMSIKMVPSTMTTLVWQTDGFTEIFGGAGFTYDPEESGWQSYPFAPIYWDGVSNIVIQTCWSQSGGWTSSAGGHQYTSTPGQMIYYQTDATGSSCGDAGLYTTTYLPNAIFNFSGCVSERFPVTAHIREVPEINIDVEDGEYCLFNNSFDIPTSPAQPALTDFLWNTGSSDTFITVSAAGIPSTYWVEVTNQWGCQDSDTLHVTLKPSPVVDLGPDTLVCEGGTVELDAGGDGESYYWNTGEVTRTIIVDDGGAYAVLVTNEFGCMATDTVNVTVEGFAPAIDGIIVDNISANTFQFTPYHPTNVISYRWNFGDSSAESVSVAPSHTYAEPGTYMVTLEVASSCGKREYYTYVTIVQSVDEQELSKNNLILYPNPTQNLITIETVGDVQMNGLTVVNNLGQEVLSQSLDQSNKVVLDVTRLPSGVYHVRIDSDKGTLIKQFQVVK